MAALHVRRVARKSSIGSYFKNTSVFRRRISTRRSRKDIRIARTASYQFKSHTRSPYLIPQRNGLHSSLTFINRCFSTKTKTDKDTGLTSSINGEGPVLKSNDKAVADESTESVSEGQKTDEVRVFSDDGRTAWVKTIVEESAEESTDLAQEGSTCDIKYIATLDDGTVFDSSDSFIVNV